MACPFKEICKGTLRLDYVEENGVSRNWCEKAAAGKNDFMQGHDVVLSEKIYELLKSGKVKSLKISLNDCYISRQTKEED